MGSWGSLGLWSKAVHHHPQSLPVAGSHPLKSFCSSSLEMATASSHLVWLPDRAPSFSSNHGPQVFLTEGYLGQSAQPWPGEEVQIPLASPSEGISTCVEVRAWN